VAACAWLIDDFQAELLAIFLDLVGQDIEGDGKGLFPIVIALLDRDDDGVGRRDVRTIRAQMDNTDFHVERLTLRNIAAHKNIEREAGTLMLALETFGHIPVELNDGRDAGKGDRIQKIAYCSIAAAA